MSLFLLCLISAGEALEGVFVSGGLFFNLPFCQRWGNFPCNYADELKESGNLLSESCPFTAVQLWWCTNRVMQCFHQKWQPCEWWPCAQMHWTRACGEESLIPERLSCSTPCVHSSGAGCHRGILDRDGHRMKAKLTIKCHPSPFENNFNKKLPNLNLFVKCYIIYSKSTSIWQSTTVWNQ